MKSQHASRNTEWARERDSGASEWVSHTFFTVDWRMANTDDRRVKENWSLVQLLLNVVWLLPNLCRTFANDRPCLSPKFPPVASLASLCRKYLVSRENTRGEKITENLKKKEAIQSQISVCLQNFLEKSFSPKIHSRFGNFPQFLCG